MHGLQIPTSFNKPLTLFLVGGGFFCYKLSLSFCVISLLKSLKGIDSGELNCGARLGRESIIYDLPYRYCHSLAGPLSSGERWAQVKSIGYISYSRVLNGTIHIQTWRSFVIRLRGLHAVGV